MATPFEAQHGTVRQLISMPFGGYDVVQVGQKVIVTEGIRHFATFLDQYLIHLLGPQWCARQAQLPLVDQHPVIQWRNIYTAAQRPDENGLGHVNIGAGYAWFRLAYDIYLIESNAGLQKSLIRRIRDYRGFQGARFEAAVAAMMLAAGYDLKFLPARGPGGQRVEYIATHRTTGHRLAVEAKSRHRPGILGFAGERTVPQQLDIGGLLREAACIDPDEPLLVFVDLNTPRVLVNGEDPRDVFSEGRDAWTDQLTMKFERGFPAVGVVFHNDASPWFLNDPLPAAHVDSFAKATPQHRHPFDARPLLQRIVKACYQRLNIPRDFPPGS